MIQRMRTEEFFNGGHAQIREIAIQPVILRIPLGGKPKWLT